MNWTLWGKGLLSAIVGAVGNGITVCIVDPASFNLFEGGFMKLLSVIAVSAVMAGGFYLKTHPIPGTE